MEYDPTLLVSVARRLDSNAGEHVSVSDSTCCFKLWLKTVRYNSISVDPFPGSGESLGMRLVSVCVVCELFSGG